MYLLHNFSKSLPTRSHSTSKRNDLIILTNDDRSNGAKGLSFAGIYVLHTEEVNNYGSQKPYIVSESILRDPEQSHRFFVKVHSNPTNSLYLIPVPRKTEEKGDTVGDTTVGEVRDTVEIVPVAEQKRNEVANVTNYKSAKLSTYFDMKLWDTSDRWKTKFTGYKQLEELDLSLFHAVERGSTEEIRSAVEKGANVNSHRHKHGASPLHAAVANECIEAVRVLLELGASVDIQAANGSRPLHWAAQVGNMEIVKELVAHGADVNATTNAWITDSVYGKASGQTALHWAAENGHMDVVLYLLQNGVVSLAEDERGKKADDVSSNLVIQSIIREEQQKEYVCVRFRMPSRGFAAEYSVFTSLWHKPPST